MKSLRGRLFLGICALVTMYILLSLALNTYFLPYYYYNNKKREISHKFTSVLKAYNGNPKAQDALFQRWQEAEGLRITILDSALIPRYDSNFRRYLGDRNVVRAFPNPPPEPPEREMKDGAALTHKKDNDHDQRRRPTSYNRLLNLVGSGKIRLSKGEYNFDIVRDDVMLFDYVSLFGRLNNGDFILIRTPAAAIEESARTASRFFLFTGLVMLLGGSVFAYNFAGRFTKPILDISGIARRMALLDFSTKYDVQTEDEVGTLGESINRLSEQLEQSILGLREANTQLKVDIEQKVKLEEMRKEFIANVSHELKTPISLIQGYAEGLKVQVNQDAEDRDFYCDVIMDEAAKMGRLVKQLLDLSKIETGHVKPEVEEFDVGLLLEQALRKYHAELKKKDVTAALSTKESVLGRADVYLVEQVVTNFLTNAVKNVPMGGSINVWYEVHQGESKVRVYVYNSGSSIPQEHLDQIWTSFYKLDKARTRDSESTGLGLSIVKAIQDAHGQQCGVMNDADGVVFWFDIALSDDLAL